MKSAIKSEACLILIYVVCSIIYAVQMFTKFKKSLRRTI